MPVSMSMKRWYHKMRLTWLNNGFICEELYAPFKIDKDIDYQVFVDKTSLTAKCVFNLNFYVQIGINKLNDKLVVVKEEKINSDLPSKEKILGNKPSDQQ